MLVHKLRGIDPARWWLVTGDAEQIYGLARRSYFGDDGRLEAEKAASEQFLHTGKALLVDREGHLRVSTTPRRRTTPRS